MKTKTTKRVGYEVAHHAEPDGWHYHGRQQTLKAAKEHKVYLRRKAPYDDYKIFKVTTTEERTVVK